MSDTQNDIAIKVEGVSKSFRLPHDKQNTIKGGLINVFKGGKRTYETQEVLKDVSFEIKKGEFFGIVGRNGSGKSTLLKMLAGIYTPTKGSIHVNGSLTPFIELGVGFNPELTGRENVFLNGSLLGFSRNETSKMYNEIVKFAELERFMDQKLKNYSSGMQVRLAFSIAIRAKGDILLLDEVLAVGDEAFQKKCNDYFEKQKANKQTIIIVTHDMNSVKKYCTRALMIDNGKIISIGNPDTVSSLYTEKNMNSHESEIQNYEDKQDKSIIINITDQKNKVTKLFSVDESINLQIKWKSSKIKNIGVALVKQTGERMFATNTIKENININNKSVEYKIKLSVAPGKYYFRIRLMGENEAQTISLIENGPEFVIKDDNSFDGLLKMTHEWVTS